MKNILLLSLVLLFTSCSSYVRTLGTRMISPEAHGGLGKGALELRLQASKRDSFDFSDETTDNDVRRAGTPYAMGAMGEIGFFKRLDFYIIPSVLLSPTIYGLKYQLIGSPKNEARAGNFSTSLMVGFGNHGQKVDDNDSLSDFFEGNIDHIYLENKHRDVGLIMGYRWSQNFLHYANGIYLNEDIKGKVTTDSGTLNDARFNYTQSGMIYSTGFIYYFAKAHWKVDYSHFVSKWSKTEKQTVNTVNLALGFNW